MQLLFAVLCLATSQGADPSYGKRTLPNGALVMVEPVPNSSLVTLQLFCSAKGTQETPGTHGWRHMLEHVAVRGEGKWDRDLETIGWNLHAKTLRDGMSIQLIGPISGMQTAASVLSEIVKARPYSQKEIDREKKILFQESMLLPAEDRLRSELWSEVYADSGLDPMGSISAWNQVTPADLDSLASKTFAADNLTLVISGAVSTDKGFSLGSQALANARPAAKLSWQKRSPAQKGAVRKDLTEAAFAVPVGPYNESATLAKMAVSLMACREERGAWFVYTPTIQPGLLLFGYRLGNEPNSAIERLRGKSLTLSETTTLLQAWLAENLKNIETSSFFRALIGSQALGARVEAIPEAIESLQTSDLESARTEILKLMESNP